MQHQPLVYLAMDLLKSGVCVNFSQMSKVMNPILKENRNINTVQDMIEYLKGRKKEKIESGEIEEGDLESIKAHEDETEFLLIVCGIAEPKDRIEKLRKKVEKFCEEKSLSEGVNMMTIHKSKGLEASRVFLLDEHLLPSKHAVTKEELQQEDNLSYVALTRSMNELYFIKSKKTR